MRYLGEEGEGEGLNAWGLELLEYSNISLMHYEMSLTSLLQGISQIGLNFQRKKRNFLNLATTF